jgi:hypothetical protein
VIAKHAEKVGDPNVNRRRLDKRLVKRIDDDAASVELLAKSAVGQDHDATIPSRRRHRKERAVPMMYNLPANRVKDLPRCTV